MKILPNSLYINTKFRLPASPTIYYIRKEIDGYVVYWTYPDGILYEATGYSERIIKSCFDDGSWIKL